MEDLILSTAINLKAHETEKLYLYLLEQNENNNYDTYDSCVVAAYNEEDARSIRPENYILQPFIKDDSSFPSWAIDAKNIKVSKIGEAHVTITRGVILASFNAG